MANGLIVMTTPRAQRRLIQARRHIAALRAFHAGLVAETHRHLRVLLEMTEQIDLLRRPQLPPSAKLTAVHETCRQLRALELLKQPWRDTFRDFRHSLHRARTLFVDIARTQRSRSKPARDAD